VTVAYHDDLRTALLDNLGRDWLVFLPRWNQIRNGTDWRGKGKPAALLLHHTAGAATDSTNPNHPGNQRGANAGQVAFIQNHYRVPAANFTLDRDGTVYIHNAYPIWHAGLGTFRGKRPWSALGIPDNLGNNYMLGVEIVSKGLKQDFTEAQKDSLVHLLRACRDASGWESIGTLRRPRHKDWTSRKVDIKYGDADVAKWIAQYGFTQAAA
jgi:hypothetical protein